MRPPALRVRLFGTLDLRLGSQQLPPLDSARAESLLAYLLLHRAAPQPRQRVAFLLWPGSSEGQAQTNLRKVLHNLRRALPEADRLIEIGPRTLRWRADVSLWLDVEQFVQAMTDGRLEEAVEIYAGELLEGRYDEWLTAERERLAGLYSAALERLARKHEQNRRWYEQAAEAAQWLHAHADAVRALERALALSAELPWSPGTARLQLRLLTALPAPLLACEGYASEQIPRVHARALKLAAQTGSDPEPPLVWSLAMAALTRGEWEAAREFGERLRDRAERDHDQVLWVESGYLRGIAAYWPGRLEQARGHFEAAMERFRPASRREHVLRYGQDPELLVRLRLAHALWLLGDPGESDRQRELALRAARESTHSYSRAATQVWAAIVAMDRGDTPGFRRHARALAALEDEGPAQIRLATEMFSGHLDVLDGRTDRGLARVRTVRVHLVSGPAPAPGVPGVATRLLLEGYLIAGRPQAGLDLAGEALGMGRGAELWEGEIRRLRAAFLAALGAPPSEVTAELDRALAVARRQQARAFEERIRGTLAERTLSHGGAL
jgi:DNA-binding SARP family transcriptional activator